MSMYHMIFSTEGAVNRGAVLLAALGSPDVGRYRDAWVEKGEGGEPVIAIYTRNGGGNRDCYCADYGREHPDDGACLEYVIEKLQAHPLYLRDADDEFDCTYATFYFRCPDGPPELVEVLREAAVGHVDTDQRWLDAIDALAAMAKGGN